ncbi:MAG: 3'(2'),5'-bisphosphate nucleotidase CysQ [Acidobacteriota bacterium]
MPPIEPPQWLLDLADLAETAGGAAAEIFHRDDTAVRYKGDASPVTEADVESQRILIAGLRRSHPDVPYIAEESDAAPWGERRSWQRAWLIDPLDGTREFVAGRDEFTINVGLVDRGRPVAGVVHAPIQGRTWLGADGPGAWRRDTATGATAPIRAAGTGDGPLVVMASRSHRDRRMEAFLRELPAHRIVGMGSSLKLCLLAEGRADAYPRLSRTMEWDTAAGDAVLRAAGGKMIDAEGTPLRYNKESLDNPLFLAEGRRPVPWGPALESLLQTKALDQKSYKI